MKDYAAYSAELFENGYNCAQAVTVAFCDVTGLDPKSAAAMSSSFGGGMGRMREVCGAVSGMLLVAGILYGYDTPGDDEAKAAHYQRVQQMASQFRQEAGSIICREILKNPASDPSPTPRSEEFYRMRPCTRMVYLAAEILSNYLIEYPKGDTQ
jgi:C_GCAxxG_C_C family probable redox protein